MQHLTKGRQRAESHLVQKTKHVALTNSSYYTFSVLCLIFYIWVKEMYRGTDNMSHKLWWSQSSWAEIHNAYNTKSIRSKSPLVFFTEWWRAARTDYFLWVNSVTSWWHPTQTGLWPSLVVSANSALPAALPFNASSPFVLNSKVHLCWIQK